MFTRCSNTECQTAFRVTAQTLRQSMGMVRCVKCRTVFNALTTLEEKRPDGVVIPIAEQLPFEQIGDRLVLDPRMLSNSGRFRVKPGGGLDVIDNTGAAVDADSRVAQEAVSRANEALDDQQDEDDFAARRQRRIATVSSQFEIPQFDKYEPSAEKEAAHAGGVDLPMAVRDFLHALRNLVRHRRRTGMGLTAISFGVLALMLAGGFIEWNNWALRESTIQSHLGHIQVMRPGFLKDGESDPFSFLLPQESDVLDALARLPEVEAVAPRLEFSGLVSFGETTVSFLGEGVLPEEENKVSRWVRIIKGENLSSAKPNGIIVGKGLADNLRVGPGDKVVLLGSSESGGLGAVEGEVVGIFQTTNKAFDDASLRVPLDVARSLLQVEGAHRWVVLLKDTALTDPVLESLRERFKGQTDLEFVPWLDMADFYKKVVVLFSAQMNLIRFIIALIIVVSISNTLFMNVMERTSEIGTLMAVGLKRKKIMSLFVQEGFILGLVGGVVGAVAGWILAEVISRIGIPMPPSPGMDFSFEGEIMVTAPLALGGVLLGLVATVLASLYPARKASRLEIVDALRHAR
ncbi:MAG: FtsX-like permease family protein [Gammaproteobacteria bacterium]